MDTGGQLFKALYVSPETPSLSDADRNKVFELCVMYYDISGCCPKSNGKMKKAWWWMYDVQEKGKIA